MNKTFFRVISLITLVCLAVGCFAGCDSAGDKESTPSDGEVDYAAAVTLDMNSETVKTEVTVKAFIDGDTTHFHVPTSVDESGVLKARYIAINTPESTGKIEEYGKTASNFTREKLSAATSIIVESDDGNWNIDSTGSRYLVWVWYKTADSDEYRNLNIEILQNGLAIASSSANNRYGETCMAAIEQAKVQKLNIYSGQKDPNFYYGEAVELDLRELRTNIESYNGIQVAFTGVISRTGNSTAYVEAYDDETDMYYGISVYYGNAGLSGTALGFLAVGNEVRIVGTVSYYETGGTWQVSGVHYRDMKPDDPANLQLKSQGNEPAYRLTDPATFANGSVTITAEEGAETYGYAELAMSTSVSMENLKVVDIYTTNDEESSSYGAMTITCQALDGTTISVRTAVLLNDDGSLVTQDAYAGKTINVKGIVDYFSGDYQIKVFSTSDIEIVG